MEYSFLWLTIKSFYLTFYNQKIEVIKSELGNQTSVSKIIRISVLTPKIGNGILSINDLEKDQYAWTKTPTIDLDENQLICEFLLENPEFRGIVKRIQSLKNYPFSEVEDNVLDKKTLPIDMLRFKLSFFGANRYDPKSDRWLRVSFFSGAPYLSDLNNNNVDEWGFATMNSY